MLMDRKRKGKSEKSSTTPQLKGTWIGKLMSSETMEMAIRITSGAVMLSQEDETGNLKSYIHTLPKSIEPVTGKHGRTFSFLNRNGKGVTSI